MVVEVGFATTPKPLVIFKPTGGDQLNVFPPEATRVVLSPIQSDTLFDT